MGAGDGRRLGEQGVLVGRRRRRRRDAVLQQLGAALWRDPVGGPGGGELGLHLQVEPGLRQSGRDGEADDFGRRTAAIGGGDGNGALGQRDLADDAQVDHRQERQFRVADLGQYAPDASFI